MDLERQAVVDRISSAGHRGLVGSAILRNPEYVFLVAAQIGGIHANTTYPAVVREEAF